MTDSRPLVRVVTAAQAAARDAAAIAAGTPSATLMDRAGTATAREIARRLGPVDHRRVLVLCGPGNNGGDGWVVARALARAGARVDVAEAMPAKSCDAIAARERARAEAGDRLAERTLDAAARESYALVVDALLGTGSTGAPRGAIADAVRVMRDQRAAGARMAAVDLPTGLDATTGDEAGAVPADLTLTYGTVKRGHLVARSVCGAVVVLDIGLGAHAALPDDAPLLVDEPWVAEHVPVIHADAHKGTRRKIVIAGGAAGMSGAVILAARAALRSGAGLVKVLADGASLDAVRAAEPAVLTAPWPEDAAAVDRDVSAWADAVAVGPGLGNTPRSRAFVQRLLQRWHGPVVLDADALNVFHGDPDALSTLLGARAAILTPHPGEFARLTQTTIPDVLARRFDIGERLASRLGAAVLLKGTPTVVFAPTTGDRLVSASGTPVLGTGGSGDLLTGIAVTLLAQMGTPNTAAACAAWVHGRAAELAQLGRRHDPEAAFSADLDESIDDGESRSGVRASEAGSLPPRRDARGLTLDDVLDALAD
ncbi:MAG: NAD(P)H-hydrate dehydratase, partial [Gemmatimonadota bacterium]|nr:NAD(P)H-hydrate dehydratase [Gemmatimonadota bacterium]